LAERITRVSAERVAGEAEDLAELVLDGGGVGKHAVGTLVQAFGQAGRETGDLAMLPGMAGCPPMTRSKSVAAHEMPEAGNSETSVGRSAARGCPVRARLLYLPGCAPLDDAGKEAVYAPGEADVAGEGDHGLVAGHTVQDHPRRLGRLDPLDSAWRAV
jgi:hypothetical protein